MCSRLGESCVISVLVGCIYSPQPQKGHWRKAEFPALSGGAPDPLPLSVCARRLLWRLLVNHWLLSHGLVRKPEIVELCAPCIHDPNSRRIGLVRQVVLG